MGYLLANFFHISFLSPLSLPPQWVHEFAFDEEYDVIYLFMAFHHLLVMAFGLTCTSLCHEFGELREDLMLFPKLCRLESLHVVF
jgi:hypothetical protein